MCFRSKEMKEALLALIGGMGVGVLFGFLKLPIPGPATLAGVCGAIGLFVGSLIYINFLG